MTFFSTRIAIDAPPARVWAVMMDVERWPSWTASVDRIERLDGGPLRVGSRVRIRQPKLFPNVFRITELHDGRRFTWVTRSPGVTVTARHAIEPSDRGSLVELSVRYDGMLGPLVAWLTRGINDRYLGLEAAGLKRQAEAPPS
jgi:uncharacterized protein YndB with AHSA1/START domain